jgi:hypothetical protein
VARETLLPDSALSVPADEVQFVLDLDEQFTFPAGHADTERLVEAMKLLFADPAIQDVVQNYRSKFQLQECVLPYFTSFQDYPTWGGPKWIPSVDDCVRCVYIVSVLKR